MFRLEVIDYIDQTGQALVARVPESGTAAIKAGAQLIVQQNQEAVFFRDGRAMDRFGPGRYTLSTANIPILTSVLTIPWERSPFQACVYFVGKQRFIDQRWGTRNPITLKDPDFGIVRLRGFGKYSFRVVDAPLLINEVVGTQGKLTTDEISGYLRDVLMSGLTDLIATAGIGLLQMAAKFDELSAAARVKLGEQFSKFGLELTDFVINSISPPEEVQKAIDARSSMSAIQDLRSYTVYQAANGMGRLGSVEGGGGAAAIGMGAGIGMMLPPILQEAMRQSPAAVPAGPGSASAAAAPGGARKLDFSQLSIATEADPKASLRHLAQASGWELADNGDHWQLTIAVGALRKQIVHVDFTAKDDVGNSVISFWSSCGALEPRHALMLLRFNSQLVHGAFALQRHEDNEILVIRGNLLADTADPLELTRTVTAIAWQADEFEEQLHGTDVV
ncbi:MAG: SPFH domain-containing protein [bacterium]|nr:SPFH domain-containing protein [bacterium]